MDLVGRTTEDLFKDWAGCLKLFGSAPQQAGADVPERLLEQS